MDGVLLDTNVLSELLKKRPQASVVRALGALSATDLYTSSICVMELRRGACAHPQSEALWQRIQSQLLSRVQILDFGEHEAVLAGDIGAQLSARGQPVGTEDVQIAATALAHGLILATRNTRHFERIPTLRTANWWI